MGTTSNYSWPYPEATGLVKDGWEDIKDLATAIDTTAASTFTGGLVKINSTAFTNVASQTLSNVFSSTYQTYFVWVQAQSTVGNIALNLRLGTSGSPVTSTVYSYGYNTCTRSGSASTLNGNDTTQFLLTTMPSDGYSHSGFYLYAPNLAQTTGFSAQGYNRQDNLSHQGAGQMATTAQYVDLQIYPASGNMNGVIKCYGLKN